jgi:hypothetical protein
LILPQSAKLKEEISEVLDADLIRQQAERGTLDFQVISEVQLFITQTFSSHGILLNSE